MKLYSAPLSPFAARVRISIYRKRLDHIEILLPPEGLKSAAYLALNPMGQIPLLQLDNGETIPESAAILEYLEDAFPTPSLRPDDLAQRARARLFMRLPDIHFQNAPRTLLSARNPAGRDPARVEAAFENLHKGLGYIDHFLGSGPWAVGDAPSIADSALVPVLNAVIWISQVYEVPDLLRGYPKIAAYWEQTRSDAIHARVIGEQNAAIAALQAPQPATA